MHKNVHIQNSQEFPKKSYIFSKEETSRNSNSSYREDSHRKAAHWQEYYSITFFHVLNTHLCLFTLHNEAFVVKWKLKSTDYFFAQSEQQTILSFSRCCYENITLFFCREHLGNTWMTFCFSISNHIDEKRNSFVPQATFSCYPTFNEQGTRKSLF
jgi:hypothetical protein